ncbi:Gti1/Pac2 family-domain-containing protein [Aspergillus leporis]|uniref:Gti1/Pac2 family-domain-containing protein n=1 Tax=Aspergillus leporis TaxID=41062 RepID=A0A5N5XCS4_9EURO|nr:Gti1/Pac2 family-domain-containing protein [Aspergillus leporis]
MLPHGPYQSHDREKDHPARSGSVLVYRSSSSGITRWTDGWAWRPDRNLGNFLVYRELDKPFPPGRKGERRRPANGRYL